jgi:hypothetical protein
LYRVKGGSKEPLQWPSICSALDGQKGGGTHARSVFCSVVDFHVVNSTICSRSGAGRFFVGASRCSGLCSKDPAQKPRRCALKVDYQKVQKAVATLSPEELARLASQTNQIQKDVAGGALTNQQLTYIVIALGTAVIVLVLVH